MDDCEAWVGGDQVRWNKKCGKWLLKRFEVLLGGERGERRDWGGCGRRKISAASLFDLVGLLSGIVIGLGVPKSEKIFDLKRIEMN